MKISRAQHAANRQKLIEVASSLLNTKGIDGLGVAEISNTAGFSHGALYAHFPSKGALMAAALAFGINRDRQQLALRGHSLTEIVEHYLAPAHRDNFDGGCSLASIASEVGRKDKQLSISFAEGFLQIAELVQRVIEREDPGPRTRDKALVVVTSIIGALAVSRSVSKADEALADDTLFAVRRTMTSLV